MCIDCTIVTSNNSAGEDNKIIKIISITRKFKIIVS